MISLDSYNRGYLLFVTSIAHLYPGSVSEHELYFCAYDHTHAPPSTDTKSKIGPDQHIQGSVPNTSTIHLHQDL